MDVKILDLESKLYEKKVVQISNIENLATFQKSLPGIMKRFKPGLVFCIVEAHDILNIQSLEKIGFGFAEFRIHSWLRLGEKPLMKNHFPYQLLAIGDNKLLEEAKEFLLSKFPDDRYYHDYLLDRTIARKRELINLEKSFQSWPGEFILGLINSQTGKLVGFRSGAFINDNEIAFYLYGISSLFEEEKTCRILDHSCMDYLFNKGVRIVHSVSTGFNTKELNRLILNHGFQIEKTEVVLRMVC
jgi:hypothetical protein